MTIWKKKWERVWKKKNYCYGNNSMPNLNYTLQDKIEIKHELQEKSNKDVYEVKDCNTKQEIGSMICNNSKVLLLDNENEITNKLEEDNKNNEYKVDYCNMSLESLGK